jgi:hypothetical protein
MEDDTFSRSRGPCASAVDDLVSHQSATKYAEFRSDGDVANNLYDPDIAPPPGLRTMSKIRRRVLENALIMCWKASTMPGAVEKIKSALHWGGTC